MQPMNWWADRLCWITYAFATWCWRTIYLFHNGVEFQAVISANTYTFNCEV